MALSHDHHQALVIAQHLRRASEVSGPAREFHRFWLTEGSQHFRVEEEVLLPLWSILGTADPAHIARVAHEHLAIRAAVVELETGDVDLDLLHRLGQLIAAHVRYEERELFQAIEEDLDASAMQTLASALARPDSTCHDDG